MFHDGRAQEVETDEVIAQIRSKVGGDRFRDLGGCELDRTLSEHIGG
jgi:hypothetical protein